MSFISFQLFFLKWRTVNNFKETIKEKNCVIFGVKYHIIFFYVVLVVQILLLRFNNVKLFKISLPRFNNVKLFNLYICWYIKDGQPLNISSPFVTFFIFHDPKANWDMSLLTLSVTFYNSPSTSVSTKAHSHVFYLINFGWTNLLCKTHHSHPLYPNLKVRHIRNERSIHSI